MRHDHESVFVTLLMIGWIALFILLLWSFPAPRCYQVKSIVIGDALVLGGCK